MRILACYKSRAVYRIPNGMLLTLVPKGHVYVCSLTVAFELRHTPTGPIVAKLTYGTVSAEYLTCVLSHGYYVLSTPHSAGK